MKQASTKQRKYFFALGKELGYGSEYLKERAKEKFDVESFMDLTSKQINELIDTMKNKTQKEHEHDWDMEARSKNHIYYYCTKIGCRAIMIEPR